MALDAAWVTLFLCGDVMTGRGVDQILPHPGDPRLREGYVTDARTYVALAEQVNGPVPRPVPAEWPWGDALELLAEVSPDVRVINLETSVTRSDHAEPGKQVHYRMSPENLGCLTVARPDACTLANNHARDFGEQGLVETLSALAGAGLAVTGAGRDAVEASRPVTVAVRDGARRVLIFGCAEGSSGVPPHWAAASTRPGINLLPDLSAPTADALATQVRAAKQPGDVAVVSIHWGSNWGYEVPASQVEFAHRLVDGGVDVVHGHSSHHPRPIEVYRDRLVLYGCGDFIDDYEGISGYERYRDDLRLLYFASITSDGALAQLRMAPMQARALRLHRTGPADTEQLRQTLDQLSRPYAGGVALAPDGMLQLVRAGS